MYLQQAYLGLPIYNKMVTMALKQNIPNYVSGKFVSNVAKKAGAASPVLTSVNAIEKVAAHLELASPSALSLISTSNEQKQVFEYSNGNIAQENIKVQLLWFYDDKADNLKLAWNVTIAPIGKSDVWHIRVDALTGNILDKGNYTVFDNYEHIEKKDEVAAWNKKFTKTNGGVWANPTIAKLKAPPIYTTATYNVYPYQYENPFVGTLTQITDPWLNAGTVNNATTYGWHFDGLSNYRFTRGNNVRAYDDSLNKNAPGRYDTATQGINPAALIFNNKPDFTKNPTLPSNRKLATDNLFYINNIMHDLTYQYGFNEAAGNFQTNNFNGRGGKGGDPVNAEAQDGLSTDNANMSAQPDGQTARMQMFLWQPVGKTVTNVTITAPANIAASYSAVEGAFSTNNLLKSTGPVTGNFVLYNDDNTGVNHRACNGAPVKTTAGSIALIFRGACNFIVKVKNAEDDGALAVVMVDTLLNTTPIIMGGTDNSITIPAVMITNADGKAIAAALSAGKTVTGTIESPPFRPQFDGALDNGIMSHEYTHGISNRLTGGPLTTSCLANAEQAGEGWSDYLALMVTTDWSKLKLTDDTIQRAIGKYVISQTPTGKFGVRQYPYTTDMIVNPHVYGDLAVNSEVHAIGEVWCSALWDMTWAIIKQESAISPNMYDVASGGGNVKALQLVMLGMKLQPCSPGFLDARDAIIAADSILYNGVHKCTIWDAFSKRGMGLSAEQGSSSVCGDELEGYDVPTCTVPLKLVGFAGEQKNGNALLRWKSVNEVEVNRFELERSASMEADGFSRIATIVAKGGKGMNEYSFSDNEMLAGKNFYRLKMIDLNGTSSYSKVISIANDPANKFSVFPNPAKNELYASLYSPSATTAKVFITDLSGKKVCAFDRTLSIGNNQLNFEIGSLKSGNYLVTIQAGSLKMVKQFAKQ